MIATYIYSPWGEIPAFQLLTKAVVIPLAILSGLWLWKGHLLKRYIGRPNQLKLGLVLWCCSSVWAVALAPKPNPQLVFKINQVEQQGTLYVNFCAHPHEWSANGKHHFKFSKLQKGSNTFLITDVPAGTYAVAVFQDINGNGKLDVNLFGFPKEPFAFSNNIVPRLSIPRFEHCTFRFSATGQVLSINLLN